MCLIVEPQRINIIRVIVCVASRGDIMIGVIDSAELVDSYVSEKDWRVKENANRRRSVAGLKGFVAEAVLARYMLDKVYGGVAKRAHYYGDLHIHDLSMPSFYCNSYSVGSIVQKGLRGIPGVVVSDPPRHFSSAMGQVVNFIMMIQQEQAGAVGLNCLDTYLAPFVRWDGLSYKQIRQIVQEFVYTVNLPFRSALESAFVNITFDAGIRSDMKDEHVIACGEIKEETYGEFEEEIWMIDKAFMDVMYHGDANERVFTFPVVTVNVTEDLRWDTEFGEWLAKITSKYGIPYFQNTINTDIKPESVRSFCCRLRGDLDKIKKYGGIFGNPDGVGSVGVVTINLPRIGYIARDDDDFVEKVFEQMEMARRILAAKRMFITDMMKKGMYPMFTEYVGHLNWMYNTVSIVGMHEALLNYGIDGGIVTDDGLRFAEEVLKVMSERVEEFENEDGVLWNIEQAPAESASGRLKACDIKYMVGYERSAAIREMGPDLPYTNSTHVPVDFTDNIWWVLRHQERLNKYYTGGSVVHIFLGERIPEDVVPTLVDRICRRTEIPYFSLTPTFSVCPKCGYLEGEQWKCPKCGSDTDVYSRIVGYFSPVQRWNKWKQAEFKARKTFKY